MTIPIDSNCLLKVVINIVCIIISTNSYSICYLHICYMTLVRMRHFTSLYGVFSWAPVGCLNTSEHCENINFCFNCSGSLAKVFCVAFYEFFIYLTNFCHVLETQIGFVSNNFIWSIAWIEWIIENNQNLLIFANFWTLPFTILSK